MRGVVKGHDGCRFRGYLMESIVFSDVAVIADAAHNQDGDFLLIAGVEYPVSGLVCILLRWQRLSRTGR